MMPVRSSAMPCDTPKQEHPSSLLGATGHAGSADLDELSGLKEETPLAMHSAISVSEGAHQWEQYCVMVQVVTAQDHKPLQSYEWNEGQLNDFLKATIGFPHSVVIMSPTECVIIAPDCSRNLGMSFDDSIWFCHTLSCVHTWVGASVQITTLQQTLMCMTDNAARILTGEPNQRASTLDPSQYDLANQELEEEDLAGKLDFDSEENDMEATASFFKKAYHTPWNSLNIKYPL